MRYRFSTQPNNPCRPDTQDFADVARTNGNSIQEHFRKVLQARISQHRKDFKSYHRGSKNQMTLFTSRRQGKTKPRQSRKTDLPRLRAGNGIPGPNIPTRKKEHKSRHKHSNGGVWRPKQQWKQLSRRAKRRRREQQWEDKLRERSKQARRAKDPTDDKRTPRNNTTKEWNE